MRHLEKERERVREFGSVGGTGGPGTRFCMLASQCVATEPERDVRVGERISKEKGVRLLPEKKQSAGYGAHIKETKIKCGS